jgi:hypothetical protein
MLSRMARVTDPRYRARLRARLVAFAGAMDRLARNAVPARIINLVELRVNAMDMMERIIEARFRLQSSRSYGGRSWAPLAPETVRRKGSSQILVDSGSMRQSAILAVAGTYQVGWDRIDWDVDQLIEDCASYHMTGTPNMPPRQFFLRPDRRELGPANAMAMRAARAEIRRAAR